VLVHGKSGLGYEKGLYRFCVQGYGVIGARRSGEKIRVRIKDWLHGDVKPGEHMHFAHMYTANAEQSEGSRTCKKYPLS
jgi:hypothetical protein